MIAMRKGLFVGLMFCMNLVFTETIHAQISIGAGSIVNMGNSVSDFSCLDLTVDGALNVQNGIFSGHQLAVNASGTVHGGTGLLKISGDFIRNGAFNAMNGEFSSVDGCGTTSTMFSAANDFYRLSVNTASGRTLILPSGATQTIVRALSLTGTAGNLLQIRSSVPGSEAHLRLATHASQRIAYVDVQDNHATEQIVAPGMPDVFNSVQGSNTDRWFVAAAAHPPIQVPAQHPLIWLLNALLIAASSVFWLRRRTGASCL